MTHTGLSLKLEPNDTSKLNNLIFSIARFKIDDMETERSDYDLGGHNRVINKDTPFVKADCPVSVKFDVYRPQNSTMSEIQFNARPMPPTKDTFYTYQTYLDAGSPNFAKVSIEKMAKDQLSAGEWVTIEKVFRFSDYAALKNGIDNGGYIAFEISPIFEAADNPVVYVDNFKVSYTSPSVYQTPDTNMISQIKISDGYRNSKWITEDTDVSYGDGSFSYKFIPHDGYPRSGDNARFDNNYYRDLNMKFSDNIDVKNNRKYRFSCWVKADTTATLINGAYLRLYKNTTVELMGITNEIVADGQWHELIYDFSGSS